MMMLVVLMMNVGFSSYAKSTPAPAPPNRVASVYVSQDFINEQMAAHHQSQILQGMNVELDPDHDQIFLRGVIHIPIEEMRAINLDQKLGIFHFQVAIKLSTTKEGYLILEFPLSETFFYPADSKNPKEDRVIVPVQMLSIALASARGYLAALSGDFKGFDRHTEKLEALIKSLNHSIKLEKNQDARDELQYQRDSLKIQLEAVPVERKQLQSLSKEFASMLGFTGEKEINLNDEFVALKNALILKVKLSQLLPYLKGVELGGVRILHDKKDGGGQNYVAIDVNANLAKTSAVKQSTPMDRPGMKVAPSLIMRLNQAIFESEAVVDAEKQKMDSKIRNFDIELKDDGLHVTGQYKTFLFFKVPFEVIVDFVSTGTDVFEVRLREMEVAGINMGVMAKLVLEILEKRLDQALKGICKFKYLGEEKDHARALQVTVDPKALIPAFPDLHLIEVDMRDREFLMKVGRP